MSLLSPIAEQSAEFAEAERRWSELKAGRSQHEKMWGDIARLMRPQRGGFSSDNPADRDLEKPLSSAPILAQSNFSAGLYGTLTNPANKWFGFRTNDPDLNAWKPAKLWMDLVTDRVLASFMPQMSPFYSAASQLFGDLASFGNAVQYDELVTSEKKIMDVTISLSEIVADIDAYGRVCEIVRRFRLKPAAAVRMFRGEALPAKIIDMAEKGDQSQIVFYHHVLNNEDFRGGYLGPKGKRWLSRYTCEVERALIRTKGYDEMPFFMARWEVDTGHTYGVGPGFVALASARVHNRMVDATLRRAQREADPTLLAPDRQDWPLNGRVRTGAVVYGGLNMQGNQMLRPLELGSGFSLTLQEKQGTMEDIRDAFHYSLMNLSGRTGMTATEVMAITEERQRLWAPHQGRVQEEYCAPKISRRFSILWRAGQLPPPPKEMQGVALDIQYLSAAAAAQRSVEGNAALRVIQDIAPLVQIKPRLADRIDEDGLIEVLADARGAPGRMFRSREEADAIAQQRQQAEQAAQTMQMAQAGTGMMKDMAGAQAQMAAAEAQGAQG